MRDGAAAGLAQGQHGRPADQLGADHDRTLPDLGVVEVDEVLQLPGRVDAVGPVAGDAPGRARAARGPRWRGRPLRPRPGGGRGRRHQQAPVAGPAGDLRPVSSSRARVARRLGQPAGVRRSGDEAAQVADAVAEVVAVTAGCRRSTSSRSITRTSPSTAPRERGRGGQAGRAAADHRDPDPLDPAAGRVTGAHLPSPSRAADPGAAEEALAAAVHHAGTAPQPVEVGRRDGRGAGVADLAGGHALAEADDAAVRGVGRRSARPPGRAAGRPHRGWASAAARRRSSRSVRSRPVEASRPRTCSAIAMPAVRPVERMPPTRR